MTSDVSLAGVGLVVMLSTVVDWASCTHFREVVQWTACTLSVVEDEGLPLIAVACRLRTALFSVCETVHVCLF